MFKPATVEYFSKSLLNKNVRQDKLTAYCEWKGLPKVNPKTKNNVLLCKSAYGADN